MIDRRAAYEESMRVPLLARCPALFAPGMVDQVVANIDVAPTMLALREDRYKYMHLHGIRDIDELYDLEADSHEADNLLARPGHEALAERMSKKLFARLEESGGMQIPLSPDPGERNDLRDPKGPKGAPFPDSFLSPPAAKLAALAQKLRPG